MIHTWEEEDIKVGVFFHRGGVGEYGASCLHKIGWLSINEHSDTATRLIATAMSDGGVFRFGTGNKKSFAEALTKGLYKPTTHIELIELVKNNPSYIARQSIPRPPQGG